MIDPFLQKTGVHDSVQAMHNSLRASLQRNQTYLDSASSIQRKEFRRRWAELLIDSAKKYCMPVTECDHCHNIAQLADKLTKDYGEILVGGRLRFGTSQKAFNLYLKFLWRLGKIPEPPHCPVDNIILQAAGLRGSWTRSDSLSEYQDWIDKIKQRASPLSVAGWEYQQWN